MKSVRAVWNGKVLAESDRTVVVEGNYYFPKDSINFDFFVESETKTLCPWKGEAYYHSLKVEGASNEDAVWYYPSPSPEALQLKDHYAFWKGVEVIKETEEERNLRLATVISEFQKKVIKV